MAREAKNFGLFDYVDDNGTDWNKRGEIDAVRNAVDGSTAALGNPVSTRASGIGLARSSTKTRLRSAQRP